MDNIVKETFDWEQRVLKEALERKQQLIDALDRVDAILSTIEEKGRHVPSPRGRYDVIDDIVPLVKNSTRPILQSEIFQTLRQKVMEKMRFSENEARASVYRSLHFHTKHGPGSDFDRGIRAVETHGGKTKVVAFKTKGRKAQYPDNLIWHVERIKAAS